MIDVDINAIRLGDLVPCVSQQHGLLSTMGDVSTYYLVSKYEIDLENPANNKIVLGRTISSLTDKVAGTSNLTNIVQGMAGSVNTAVNTANNAANTAQQVKVEMDAITNKIWPVNSIYINTVNVNPSTFLGGVWVPFATGKTIVGVDTGQTEFNTPEKSGGHKELQSHAHGLNGHNHSVNITSGGQSASHNHTTGNSSYKYWPVATGIPEADSGDVGGNTYKYPRIPSGATWGKITNTGNQSSDHSHYVSGSTGGNSGNTTSTGGGNAGNLQPYITVYMWKRIS